MGPAIRGGGSDLDVTIVSGLYPAMDVVLLAGFVGFFVSPAWRTTSFRYLLAAVAALLVGDEITGLAGYTYKAGDAVDVTWMLSYVLFAAAALHPSMRELAAPRRIPTLRVSVWRIGLLAGALLTAPVALFVQHLRHKPLDVIEITALAGAVSVLVVARMTGILRALERIRMRERSARALAEEAHSQLLFHNEQLLEADKLKDEFVALISHDLRTPLTSIVGYIELALDDAVEPPLDEERRGYLDVVARSSERLLGLVDDLLFVARLQSGSLEIDPHEIDLGRITAQAVEDMRAPCGRQGCGHRISRRDRRARRGGQGPDLPVARQPHLECDQVHTRGRPHRAARGRTDAGCVLEVADTGIGLSPGDAERVFDRFFRSERATNRQIQGTGLGLFIARAITDAHGGKIGVTSTVGEGTTFRIELPTKASTRDKAEAELVA